MMLSGLQRLTLLDFPGHVACIAFLPGCNLRCHYCHNSELVLPEKLQKMRESFIPEEIFFRFLELRKGKLDAVVISGGEPTIHPDLVAYIQKIRSLGFLIKLDTNGTNPDLLAQLLDEGMLDYVALDIKASLQRMEEFCGTIVDETAVFRSRDLLFSSGISYELRTTLVREFHDPEEWERLCHSVAGAKLWALQNFRSKGGCLNPLWEQYHGFSEDELLTLQKQAEGFVKTCILRS